MRVRLVAMGLAIALAASAGALAHDQSAPEDVDMSAFCSRLDLDNLIFYPRRARSRGISGRVVIDCSVTPEGRLAACHVASEEPTGWDFGRHGLQLACNVTIAVDENGVPQASSRTNVYHTEQGQARVRFPFTFRPS